MFGFRVSLFTRLLLLTGKLQLANSRTKVTRDQTKDGIFDGTHLERLVGLGAWQVRHNIVGFQWVHHHLAGLLIAGGGWNNYRPGIRVRIVGRIGETLHDQNSIANNQSQFFTVNRMNRMKRMDGNSFSSRSVLIRRSVVRYLLENVVLFGHHDQLEIGTALLYHLDHLGVGFAHDRLAIDAHHLVT